MTYSSRQTPQLAAVGGLQTESLASGTGAVLLGDLFTIPPEANGCWIQEAGASSAPLKYRMDGSDAWAAGADALELYAPAYLQLTNRQQLLQTALCSSSGTKSVTVQFFTGQVGPLGAPPKPANVSGVIPPPPPGLSAIPTINVCHVMKNSGGQGGNDATGTRNRLDLPFLTIAAAEAAAQPGDTIVIWPGTYTEDNLAQGLTNLTYYLLGGIIAAPGSNPTFSISGSINIMGSGTVQGENAACLYITAGGQLRCSINLSGQNDAGLLVEDGQVDMMGNIEADQTAVQCNAGRISMQGNARSFSSIAVRTAAASESAAIIDITGNVQGETVGILTNSGTVRVTGNVTATDQGINASNGRVIVRGSVSSTTTTAAGAVNGFIEVHGNVDNVDSYGVYVTGSGGVDVWGNVTSEGDYGAAANSGLVRVWGDVTLTATGNGNAAVTNGGTMEIYGRVRNLGLGTNAFCQSGTLTIYGDCFATDSGDAARCELGTMKVYGDCDALDGRGVFVTSTGTLYCEGLARSDARAPAECNGGTLTLGRGATTTVGNSAVRFGASGGTVVLEGNCYLANDTTGNIITETGGGGTVNSRGAYANNITVAGGVTLNGTLNLI